MFQFRKRAQEVVSEPSEAPPTARTGDVPVGRVGGPPPALPGRSHPESEPSAHAAHLGASSMGPEQAAPTPRRTGGDAEELLGDKARKMNLVGGNDLAASVDQAVRRALARHLPDVTPEIAAQVSRASQGTLLLLLKSRSKRVRGLPKAHFLKEVEASKRKIVAEREAARRELEGMLEELGKKRVEFRQTRETLVRETFHKGIVQDQELSEIIYQALGGADATSEMAQLQRRITGLVLDSLQRERQKGVDEQTSAHGEELRRYELRIAKLTKSLELTEEELKRIAAMKSIDPGVASIYRTIQGLNAEDDHAGAKKEMLAGIFQANLALQKQAVRSAAG